MLALPAAPRAVVLSGCATGRASDEAAVADLSLAASFLLAGADTVVATARPVRDQTGRDIAALLYERAEDADWQLREALRAAQLTLAQREDHGGPHDWSAYRMIIR